MAIHARRSPAPIRKRYKSYKKFLREDFNYKCVFCGIHENDHGGFWHFHVEHYKPKSITRFSHLKTDYSNLLYSCDHCNIRKGILWPSDDPMKDQIGWLDPCSYDLDQHYQFQLTGNKLQLITHSKIGMWITIELLLDNSIRTDVLEKIAIKNKLDLDIIAHLETELVSKKTLFSANPSALLQNEIMEKEDIYLRLVAEQHKKYMPMKFARLVKQ